MDKTQRLNEFAFNIIQLVNSEEAYQETRTLAVYLDKIGDPATSAEVLAYYGKQVSAMEQAAQALKSAKDRIIADYNHRLDKREPLDKAENWFAYPVNNKAQPA